MVNDNNGSEECEICRDLIACISDYCCETGEKWNEASICGNCKQAIINQVSKQGQTPFQLAKTYEIVKIFLDYNILPKQGVIHNLLEREDNLAELAYNHLIKDCNNFYSESFVVKFDLEIFQEHIDKKKDFDMTYHNHMVKCGSRLIYHPLSVLLTELKWSCKSKIVRYLHPMIQFIFTIFLTWMTFCQFAGNDMKEQKSWNCSSEQDVIRMVKTRRFDMQELTNISYCWSNVNTTGNEDNETSKSTEPHCIIPALISCICLIFLLCFEIWQILRAPLRFIRKSENWLDLALVISSAFSLAHVMKTILNVNLLEEKIDQRFFAGISIFLAWYKIVLLLQYLPKAGGYVRIFIIVARELLYFLLIYLPILIAFCACFFVLLPSNTAAFKNAWISGLKTFSMLVGEITFDGMFINNDDFEKESVPQILLLQIMSICFICLVSIVLSNLLTGLAIKEIEKLEKEAWTTSIKDKTDELIEDDNVFNNRIWSCFGDRLIDKLKNHTIVYIMPFEHLHKSQKRELWKIFKTTIGQNKKYSVFIHPSDELCQKPIKLKGLGLGYLKEFDHEMLIKTSLEVPEKLIETILVWIKQQLADKKSEEKSEEESKSNITSKEVIKKVKENRSLLNKIAKHLEIDVRYVKPCDCEDSKFCPDCEHIKVIKENDELDDAFKDLIKNRKIHY